MSTGFLNINKPENITSHGVAQTLKHELGIKRIGHTGTLDPFATGVLVIGIGKATKLIEFLVGNDKEYEATIILGRDTDSHDRTGKQTSISDIKDIPIEKVRAAVKNFEGEIEQIPPMHSAVKVGGKKLYEMARKGEEIERKPRKVNVKLIEILEYNYPLLKIRTEVSSGTYIRAIARDIGKELGCGAYLNDLMRTRAGKFEIKDSVPLDAITKSSIEKYAIPTGEVLDLNTFIATPEQIERIKKGQLIEIESTENRLAAIDPSKNILAILEKKKDMMYHPRKVLI